MGLLGLKCPKNALVSKEIGASCSLKIKNIKEDSSVLLLLQTSQRAL